ncbi:MAG TPA: BolA family transcriptional regulator, partial [Candidatus Thioglobus sp.]|nr:BolA family transcriptional regulator [Candidatus Thioglobus sp.]
MMTNMENHLKNQLDLSLSPSHCEVLNESSQHSGPATESH